VTLKHHVISMITTAALLAGTTAPVAPWQRTLPAGRGDGEVNGLAVTDAGDLLAVGPLYRVRHGRGRGGLGVVKLRRRNGIVAWKRILRGLAYDVALDSGDDVLVGATDRQHDFVVLKFLGVDGTLRWRRELEPGYAFAVTTDARDDAVAAGTLDDEQTGHWIVAKLSGSRGIERWRHVIAGGSLARSAAYDVVVDPVGDVVAAGATMRDPATTSMAVVKLAGAEGAELWRSELAGDDADASSAATAVRLDSAGDVIVAGWTGGRISPLQSRFAVAKFAGVDGALRWQQVLSPAGRYAYAADVAIDSRGAVFAVGALPQPGPMHGDFAAVKLDGLDGRELWRVVIDGPGHVDDGARAVSLDADGNAIVAGHLEGPGSTFAVMRLRGLDGAQLSRLAVSGGYANAVVAIGNGLPDVAAGVKDSSFFVTTLSEASALGRDARP
jgi:outer membrane protein assembly factor BamB